MRQQRLFGDDLVAIAIERLRAFCPPEGYYLAFSGGKDSCCLIELAKLSGVKFDAHYNAVGIDPPELVAFIKEHHADVEFVYPPERRFFAEVRKRSTPPTRVMRYCCEALKERGGSGRVVLTGVRWAESARRAKRLMVESCRTDVTKRFVQPIIDWTDDDVWWFIRDRKLPYCSLYDAGRKRIGCMLCPMSRRENMLRDVAEYPKLVHAWKRNLQWIIDHRREAGNPVSWTTGAEWFEWWISCEAKAQTDEGQQCFRFDQEPDDDGSV